jgi:hypothetical protein
MAATERPPAWQPDLFAGPPVNPTTAQPSNRERTLLDPEELWDLVALARAIAEDEQPRSWEALKGLEKFFIERDELLRDIELAVGLTDWVPAHRAAVRLGVRLLWDRMYEPEDADNDGN